MSERSFEVRSESRESVDGVERVTFAVHVPAGICYFRGHFEGYPLLPAVAQLNSLVVPLVHRTWSAIAPLRRALRLKFHRPIRPGDDLSVRLERKGDAPSVNFTIELDGAPASSGALYFGEVTP